MIEPETLAPAHILVNKWLSLGVDPRRPMGAFMTSMVVGLVSLAVLAVIAGAFLAIPLSLDPPFRD